MRLRAAVHEVDPSMALVAVVVELDEGGAQSHSGRVGICVCQHHAQGDGLRGMRSPHVEGLMGADAENALDKVDKVRRGRHLRLGVPAALERALAPHVPGAEEAMRSGRGDGGMAEDMRLGRLRRLPAPDMPRQVDAMGVRCRDQGLSIRPGLDVSSPLAHGRTLDAALPRHGGEEAFAARPQNLIKGGAHLPLAPVQMQLKLTDSNGSVSVREDTPRVDSDARPDAPCRIPHQEAFREGVDPV